MKLFVRDKYFYRSFLVMTFCIAAQNLLVFSVNMADNIMLGAYSETALSGVALCNQIQFILQMIVSGIAEASIVLASQYWGKQELAPIRKIFSIAVRIAVCVGLLLFAVVFIFPEKCLGLLTNDLAVIADGVGYLRIICFSYVFFAMTTTLVMSLRSIETVRIGFIVPISTLIINVSLNYILIFGNFGAPGMGARGAAVATLTARIVEFLIVLIYLKFIEKKLRLRLKTFLKLDWNLLRDYIRVATPVILSNGLWGIAMAIQTGILGHLGASAIAASSIANTLFQILTVVSYGTASSAAVLTGKTVGEGALEQVKEYARTMQILFFIIGLLTGLALFISRDFILSFYTISGDTKTLASQFITVLSVTVCGTAYQVGGLTGIVRGGGDTKFVLYNDLIFMWGIVLPLSALAAFVFKWSPVWVFAALKCDQILKCAVALVKVNRFRWIRQLTRSKEDVVSA